MSVECGFHRKPQPTVRLCPSNDFFRAGKVIFAEKSFLLGVKTKSFLLGVKTFYCGEKHISAEKSFLLGEKTFFCGGKLISAEKTFILR